MGMTNEQLQAEIARLKAENETLSKAKVKGSGLIKVSAKGAVSVYGMGRWPVTLYMSQWAQLFNQRDAIEKFILDNAASLSVKEAADAKVG